MAQRFGIVESMMFWALVLSMEVVAKQLTDFGKIDFAWTAKCGRPIVEDLGKQLPIMRKPSMNHRLVA